LQSILSKEEFHRIFDKYAGLYAAPVESPARTSDSLKQPAPAPQTAVQSASSATSPAQPTADASSTKQATVTEATESPAPAGTAANAPVASSSKAVIMSLEGFSAFLLSPDNSAFADQNGKVWHDMTRPLSEYYISSSHNTYLVGHQLVGVSTIEGYIRALLHSCRSVECEFKSFITQSLSDLANADHHTVDVYDGDTEPMIFHGKTFTSKVSLRDVCLAIAKYAFVASPYPVIISAEVHCGLLQQEMMAKVMTEVFGDALVSAPIEGRAKILALPSPEDLKGRFLLKASTLSFFERSHILSCLKGQESVRFREGGNSGEGGRCRGRVLRNVHVDFLRIRYPRYQPQLGRGSERYTSSAFVLFDLMVICSACDTQNSRTSLQRREM
jgi:phosphatidylinositol phospholipase C delta